MKLRFLTLTVVLLTFPALLFAGSSCVAPTIAPADGRIVDFDFVAAAADNFYQFDVSAGRSYSVEVRQDYDDLNPDVTATVTTDAACGTAVTGTTDTSAFEPALPANSKRLSFTAATSGSYHIQIHNANASVGHYVSVSVSETTIYNARWSTFGGFITQYNFVNTTSHDITGTLTVVTTGGGAVPNRVVGPFTVTANSNTFKIVGPGLDADVAANHVGIANFTYNGPPGSILADSYFINGSATVIVPSRFEPVRQAPR